MVHLGDVPSKFVALLSKAVSLFLLIVCFFVLQRIFDLDFLCICRPGPHVNDFLFIFFPPLILTWIVILTEYFYQRSFCCCSNRCCNNFCSFIWNVLIKYVYLAAVWASTVLLDGDWYVCLRTNRNSAQTGLPCRENLTYEEKLIKADYVNESLDIGLGVIGVMFVVWNVYEHLKLCIRRTRCKGCCKCSWLCPPYYRAVYEDLLSEAVKSHLENKLKDIAVKKAEQICKQHLEIIQNHELPGQNHNDRNVINNSGNPPANAGDANNSSNSNANGNSNENPNENPNHNGPPNENPNENPNPNGPPSGPPNENPNPNGPPNGPPNENPNPNGPPNENPNPNGSPSGPPDENPNPNGSPNGPPDENPNPNGPPNGPPDENPNPNGPPNENPNNNPQGNNERVDIFDTWQAISLSSFYLLRTHPNGPPNGPPNENPNNNPQGNNERVDIFDTWQKISLSSFYLLRTHPNGPPNENPNPNGSPNGPPNENPNPNGPPNGPPNENPNPNGSPNGPPNENPNPSGPPNENPNNNPQGNNERVDIFDTWQKISLSSFYLMNENE